LYNFLQASWVDVGKFLELSTVWTAIREETGPRHDKSLAQRVWRTRQIGIFFAKVSPSSWLFVVLLAPLSSIFDSRDWKEEEFNLCVRASLGDNPYQWISKEMNVVNLILNIIKKFGEEGPTHLSDILIDVLWGWERYFAQIKNDIRGVWQPFNDDLMLDYDQTQYVA
jgi:hypothetical protein